MTLNLLDNYTARRGTVGIYVDMATLYSANDERYVASLYFQPAHRHLAAKAYHHLWERPTRGASRPSPPRVKPFRCAAGNR
jgi:hypothetical protein